jgi:hypothetical protein
MTGNAKIAVKIVKSARSLERVTNNKQGPALSHDR